MKLSKIILIFMMAFIFTSLFATNMILKKTYDQLDKSDLYWNYYTILKEPFKHIKIEGGNITSIVFEPNNKCSVRVLDYWEGYIKDSTVKAYVKNDTLHFQFLYKPANLGEKNALNNRPVIRIAAPELLSVEGFNTNFKMYKLQQASLKIKLFGKSSLKVESNLSKFETLNISQADTTKVTFEMNPAIKGSATMKADAVTARIQGVSILDIGHIQVLNPNFSIADTSAIIISGRTYRH